MFLYLLLFFVVGLLLVNLFVTVYVGLFLVRLADRLVGEMEAVAMTPTVAPPLAKPKGNGRQAPGPSKEPDQIQLVDVATPQITYDQSRNGLK